MGRADRDEQHSARVLDKILTRAVPRDNANARLEVVRLYLESDRYRDAQKELEQVVHDFPDMKELERRGGASCISWGRSWR